MEEPGHRRSAGNQERQQQEAQGLEGRVRREVRLDLAAEGLRSGPAARHDRSHAPAWGRKRWTLRAPAMPAPGAPATLDR
ncbi:hypothetical protein OF001_U40121 [Pseudomonas sp. OF001]|nr:hypothetical protein OF001_U40121 [Pseudomonas sp. OF001]